MRRFYLEYPNSATSRNLRWSHYVELMGIKDHAVRRNIEKRAEKEYLVSRDLRRIVREEKRAASGDEGDEKNTQNGRKKPRKSKKARLRPLSNIKLFTYRKAPKERLIAEEGYVAVDCGFYVYRLVPKSEAPRFTTKPSYAYTARVTTVIDGDTLRVSITLGFHTTSDERLRLRGINAAELETSQGRIAKKKVAALLPPGTMVVIRTHGKDTYGRYLADVWWNETGAEDSEDILEKGTYLNQYLVDIGIADLI